MKHIIAITTLVLLGGAVIVTGLWYQQEQEKQRAHDTIRVVQNRTPNPGSVSHREEDQDPFGLFGANTVTYEVVFDALWSEQAHSDYWIRTAHFSPPVVWVGSDNPVFALGSMASPGMKEMAETGRTTDLKQELEGLRSQGHITQYAIGERVETPGQTSYRVTLDRDNPVISLVSMIAPSPDWFVAVEGFHMLEQGRWLETKTIQTIALDAGTEEGNELKIANSATEPQEPISELTDIPTRSLLPFAQVTIKQIGYDQAQ